MQCDTLRTKGWENPTQCNVVEKTFETRWKKRMIGQIDNQMPTFSPTYNLKHTQCKLEGKFEIMLIKE
jgi:hypothetical protein